MPESARRDAARGMGLSARAHGPGSRRLGVSSCQARRGSDPIPRPRPEGVELNPRRELFARICLNNANNRYLSVSPAAKIAKLGLHICGSATVSAFSGEGGRDIVCEACEWPPSAPLSCGHRRSSDIGVVLPKLAARPCPQRVQCSKSKIAILYRILGVSLLVRSYHDKPTGGWPSNDCVNGHEMQWGRSSCRADATKSAAKCTQNVQAHDEAVALLARTG